MRKESIEGIGSIQGGEYEKISIEGIGKLKGNAKAGHVSVEGLYKGKGKLDADTVSIEGVARIFRNIKARKVNIEGVLKLRRASLSASEIYCEGVIVCNKEVSADIMKVDGYCSITSLVGDKIEIVLQAEHMQKIMNVPMAFHGLLSMYFGRDVSLEHNLVDSIECTELIASRLKSKVVRAGSVKLSNNCIIDRLYCDGEIQYDNTCTIKQIYSKSGKIIKEAKMANPNITKILDMYKSGSINADEAETMLKSLNPAPAASASEANLPWADDGKMRIVVFIGTRLLKHSEEGAKNIEVKYDGEALDVESYGSLNCGNVGGDAKSGGGMNAKDVKGSLSAGGSVNCQNVGGNAVAGGSISCHNVGGSTTAGGGVRTNVTKN